jgi:hypothetical protein
MGLNLLENSIVYRPPPAVFEHASEGNPAVDLMICEGDKKSKKSRDKRFHKCSNVPSKHQQQNLGRSENATF